MTTCACGNCQFFDSQSEAKEEDSGLCRFNPPMPQPTANGHAGEGHGVWPVVAKKDWCGHFAATRRSVHDGGGVTHRGVLTSTSRWALLAAIV